MAVLRIYGFGDFLLKSTSKKINNPKNYSRSGCCFLTTNQLKFPRNWKAHPKSYATDEEYAHSGVPSSHKGEWITVGFTKGMHINAIQ